VETIEASMHRAVDHYLEVCQQRGEKPQRPFSGKLNVRLGADLHRAAAVAAAAEGESLNSWLARVVEEAAQSNRHGHASDHEQKATPPAIFNCQGGQAPQVDEAF
jgi:HicB family